MIGRVVIGRGNKRQSVALSCTRHERREETKAINNFLFPTDGAWWRAKRRAKAAIAAIGGQTGIVAA